MANGLFAGGDGTELNPYLIEDAHDLNAIRNNSSAHYKLINDIDLNVSPYNEGAGWNPIPLFGINTPTLVLDGYGFSIKNLYMYRTEMYISLFKGTTNTAHLTIKNLKLTNVSSVNHSGSSGYTAGLVGTWNKGSLAIENCTVDGNVSGYRFIGLLIGNTSGADSILIKNTYVSGTCSWRYNGNAGGLIGGLSSNNTTIINSYSNVIVTPTDPIVIGGFIGACGTSITDYSFQNSYWNTSKTTKGGNNSEAYGAIPLTDVQMQTAQTFIDASWNTEMLDDGVTPVWILEDGEYPKLWFENTPPMLSNVNLSNTHLWYKDIDNINLSFTITDKENNQVQYKLLINDLEFISLTELSDSPQDISIDIPKANLTQELNNIKLIAIDSNGAESIFTYDIRKEDTLTESFKRDFIFESQWPNISNLTIEDNQLKLTGSSSIITTDNNTLVNTEKKYNIIGINIDASDDIEQASNSTHTMLSQETAGEGKIFSLKISPAEFNKKILSMKHL